MGANETYSEINGYLDLYLLAGSLGDKQWQEEVLSSTTKGSIGTK